MMANSSSTHRVRVNLLRLLLMAAALLLPIVFIEPAPSDLLLFGLTLLYMIYFLRVGFTVLMIFMVYTAGNVIGFLSIIGSGFEDLVFDFAVRYLIIEAYLSLAMIATFYMFAKNQQYQHDFAVYYFYGAVLSCALLIFLKFAGSDPVWIYRDEYRLRIKGMFKDPNVLGPYLNFPALMAVFYTDARFRIWLRAVAVALILYILFLTLSRAAIGGVVIALCLTVLIKWLREGRHDLLFAGALLTAALAMLGGFAAAELDLFAGEGGDTYASRRAGLQEYDSFRFRIVYESILDSIEEPWGLGPGVYEFGKGLSPHNLTMGKAIEVGWINGLIITGVLFWATWSAFRTYLRHQDTLALLLFASLFSHCVMSMVINSHHWRHMLLMIVLAFARERWLATRARDQAAQARTGVPAPAA